MKFYEIADYIKQQDRTTVFVYAYNANPEDPVRPVRGIIQPSDNSDNIFDYNSMFVSDKSLFQDGTEKDPKCRACLLEYETTELKAILAYNEHIMKYAEAARKKYVRLANELLPVPA